MIPLCPLSELYWFFLFSPTLEVKGRRINQKASPTTLNCPGTIVLPVTEMASTE